MVFSRKTFLALVVATATTSNNGVYGHRGGIRGLTNDINNSIYIVNDNDNHGRVLKEDDNDKYTGGGGGGDATVPVPVPATATVPSPTTAPGPAVLSASDQFRLDCRGPINSLSRCTGQGGQSQSDCLGCIYGYSTTSSNNANQCKSICGTSGSTCDDQIANTLGCARGEVEVEAPTVDVVPDVVVEQPTEPAAPGVGVGVGVDTPPIVDTTPIVNPPTDYASLTTTIGCPDAAVESGESCVGLIPSEYLYHKCAYADRTCSCRSDAPLYMCQDAESNFMMPPPPSTPDVAVPDVAMPVPDIAVPVPDVDVVVPDVVEQEQPTGVGSDVAVAVNGGQTIPTTVDFSSGSNWCPSTIINCSPCAASLPEGDFEGSCAQITQVPYGNAVATVEVQCRCATQEIANPAWDCRFIGGEQGTILVPVSPICSPPEYTDPEFGPFPGDEPGGPGGPSEDEEFVDGPPAFEIDPMEPPADMESEAGPPAFEIDPMQPPPATDIGGGGINVEPNPEANEDFDGEEDFVVESICGETPPTNGSGCENPGLNCGPFYANPDVVSLDGATQCACTADRWVCAPFSGGIGEVFSDDETFNALPDATLITEPSIAVIDTAPNSPLITNVGGLSTNTCATNLPTTLGLGATSCALPETQICCYGVQLARATICTCTGNENGRTYVCTSGSPNDCPDNQNPNIITQPPQPPDAN